MRTAAEHIMKILLPLLLGGAILYWMYRDFDLSSVMEVMRRDMNWTWMLLSFPFGILAQMLRGWRWKQMLDPIRGSERREELQTPPPAPPLEGRGAAAAPPYPRTPEEGTPEIRSSVCVNAVFLSYAASLVIPRIGEFTRCGVLKQKEGMSFAKALGTVVTERAIDTLLLGTVTCLTLLFAMSTFGTFFQQTGTSIDSLMQRFSWEGYLVTLICGVAALILLHLLLRRLAFYDKVKTTLKGIWQGIVSLRHVSNLPLFVAMTIGIWVCYFLHYYLTFFCFPFTAQLGLGCALITFVVGSIAVVVPTPNGAGPWHFAVKTMLILYGVADNDALYFVLIVHTVQTLLVIALGVYAWIALAFSPGVRGYEGTGVRE